MCGIKINGFDHRIGVEMVGLSVHLDLGLGVARHVAHADRVLDQPLVDCFGGMCHEDTALEVGLGQDVGQ